MHPDDYATEQACDPMPDDEMLLENMRKHNAGAREQAQHHRMHLERCERIIAATQQAIDSLSPPETKTMPNMASSGPMDGTAVYR